MSAAYSSSSSASSVIPSSRPIATASALVIESVMLFVVTKNRLGFHVFIWGRTGH